MTAPRHRRIALAHGGAEADGRHADGPRGAAEVALRVMRGGASALEAAVEAVRILEDDPRFNAGRGSNLRLDGRTLQMDAALLDSTGRFASVLGIRDVRNPILVARDLLDAPDPVLAGEGATRFARSRGHAPFDARTPEAQARHADVLRELEAEQPPARRAAFARSWNYEAPLPREAPGTRAPGAGGADTVGAVAFDGETFAAAGSTGGLVAVLDGRVSDVGLPGCGLDASDAGAVCVTGAGNDILRARVASRVLRLVEGGEAPRRAAERALAWLPPGRALGILVATREEHAAASRSPFPWAAAEEGR